LLGPSWAAAHRGRRALRRSTSKIAPGDFVSQTENENRKRHPHVPVRTVALEPEQQVGRAAAGKAFRSRRTCTMLPATHCPWVVQTRVRGNPERVSNTAGDATSHSTRTSSRARSTRRQPIVRVAGPSLSRLRPARAGREPARWPRFRAWRPGSSVASTRWPG
jgi:hypothetical protein